MYGLGLTKKQVWWTRKTCNIFVGKHERMEIDVYVSFISCEHINEVLDFLS